MYNPRPLAFKTDNDRTDHCPKGHTGAYLPCARRSKTFKSIAWRQLQAPAAYIRSYDVSIKAYVGSAYLLPCVTALSVMSATRSLCQYT